MKFNSFNEVITLIQPVISSAGVETETSKQIFAGVSSVGFNEFYSANQSGFKPEIKFTIADYLDYNNEPIISWNSVRYNVIRTYRTGMQNLEITCERVNGYGAV